MTTPIKPRFAANLSLLFADLDLLDRPAAAKAHGFDAVELWWPYPEAVPAEADLDRLGDALSEADVTLVGLNFDAGDMSAGDRGLVSAPGAEQRFKDNVDCVVSFARRTGTTVFNALYGNESDNSVERGRQREWALQRLAYAIDAVVPIGGTVVLETQNRVDSPRYPLTDPHQVTQLVDELALAGHPGSRFLCDLYHLQMAGHDLRATIASYADVIAHVQIADTPGRHEPGTGDIDFATLFGLLASHGYDGWIAAEYRPAGTTVEGLAWLDELGGTSSQAVTATEPGA